MREIPELVRNVSGEVTRDWAEGMVGRADHSSVRTRGDSSMRGTGLLAVGTSEEPRVAGGKYAKCEPTEQPGPGWEPLEPHEGGGTAMCHRSPPQPEQERPVGHQVTLTAENGSTEAANYV